MKFKLRTVEDTYDLIEGKDISHIEKLKGLGFKFIQSDDVEYRGETYKCVYKDGNVRPEIEISSVEELVDFTKKYGKIIMIEDVIRIYDGYAE